MDKQVTGYWEPFDPEDKSTWPIKAKKYLIQRKDNKVHWEPWNGTGWAYNHKVIVAYAAIQPYVTVPKPAKSLNDLCFDCGGTLQDGFALVNDPVNALATKGAFARMRAVKKCESCGKSFKP